MNDMSGINSLNLVLTISYIMNYIIKKTSFIILLSFWALLIGYTLMMSIVFSLSGMLVTDTGLTIGYIGIFLIMTVSLLLTIRMTRGFRNF